jgi:hypothetical protein
MLFSVLSKKKTYLNMSLMSDIFKVKAVVRKKTLQKFDFKSLSFLNFLIIVGE